ncbi:hypothetical protein [Dactylosporangium salmoneum]|uniref:Tetratricopeptide repeat protein n=1 Tax=Dactylosporangium salmoneum TaxID=53361 RepID=A0ABP5UBU5_9ACTN
MANDRARRWWGRAAGSLTGLAAAGGAASGTNYIHSPLIGVSVAAAGALVGFPAGLAWDRRAERLARQRQWDNLFTDGPGPGPGGHGSPDSAWYWLAPWLAVVPFETRRRRYAAAVHQWCAARLPGRVWRLSGGPGSGKTRLAIEIARALREDERQPWTVGWARPGRGAAGVELAAGWDRPTLIVVDDADARDDLGELLAALDRAAGPQTVRLLLVARDFGDWWTAVQQPLPTAVDLAGHGTRLGPIAEDAPGQRVAAKQALAWYAAKLGTDPSGPRLTGITAGTPLILLHAAALAAAHRPGPIDVTDAVAELLAEERAVWRTHAARQGLDEYPQVTTDVLRDLLAFTMLTGARTAADTHRLVPLVPGLHDAGPELVDRLNAWLHLYDRFTGYWTRPRLPGVIAEHLTADALAGNTDLAAAVALTAATDEHATRILTFLGHAATHATTAAAATTTLLDADPERLIPLAVRTARRGHHHMDRAIADAVDRHAPGWSAAQGLRDLLPQELNVLTHTQIATARACARTAPTDADRATALTLLADLHSRSGRSDEAITNAAEAVATWRNLAEADPATHRPNLAGALIALSEARRQAGHFTESVTIAVQAVAAWRTLAEAEPAVHRQHLAKALSSLAGAYRQAGRIDDAITTGAEAVALRRDLATTGSGVHRAHLAEALVTLAEASRLAGRFAEAISSAGEAASIHRDLAVTNPAPHRPSLANALTTVADAMRLAGMHGEAVANANEAVIIWRPIAAADPAVHRSHLANALTALADAQTAAGRYGEAVINATEAATAWRDLAALGSIAHQAALANGLTSLAHAQSLAHRLPEAVASATDAVAAWRPLAAADPTAYETHFATALVMLAHTRRLVGRHEEAIAAATEAVDLYDSHPEWDQANKTAAEEIIRLCS